MQHRLSFRTVSLCQILKSVHQTLNLQAKPWESTSQTSGLPLRITEMAQEVLMAFNYTPREPYSPRST
jgi:hypothetical protein